MSKCISRHGEYSEHQFDNGAGLADEFTCVRCWVLDEDAIHTEIDRLRAEVKRYRDAFAGLYIAPDAHNEPTIWADWDPPMAFARRWETNDALWEALARVLPERAS